MSVAVHVDDVSKRFVLRKDKSIKERLFSFGNAGRGKEDFWALRDVSFDVEQGETIGLIGANGSGKSTLLKTVGGIILPTSGSVRTHGRIAALLELGAGFHPDLTGRENVYLNAGILGMSRKETDRVFDSIVDFSGIPDFIDTQVKFYSSGMYVRLAFAVAVHSDPEILLVDEVLAVGDEPFQRKCLDRIKRFQAEGRTIVLVSHAAETIGEHCNQAVVLKHGIVQFHGETGEALRVLRGGFEADLDRETKRDGDHPFIVDVAMRVANREGGTVLKPGSRVEFDVDVDSGDRELADWTVGIGIETPLGHVVYGTNTLLLGAVPTAFSGRRRVTFALDDVNLGIGHYQLRTTFTTTAYGRYDERAAAVEFDAVTASSSIGDIWVTAQQTQVPLP